MAALYIVLFKRYLAITSSRFRVISEMARLRLNPLNIFPKALLNLV